MRGSAAFPSALGSRPEDKENEAVFVEKTAMVPYRLCKDALEEDLHNERWIREYSLYDLGLLPDRGANLAQEFLQTGLVLWWYLVWIW